jgi:hypothetical protein
MVAFSKQKVPCAECDKVMRRDKIKKHMEVHAKSAIKDVIIKKKLEAKVYSTNLENGKGKRGNLKDRKIYNKAIREIWGKIATTKSLEKVDGFPRVDALDVVYQFLHWLKTDIIFPLQNLSSFYHLVYVKGKNDSVKEKLESYGFCFTSISCMCFCNQFKNYINRVEDGDITPEEAYKIILNRKYLWHEHALIYINNTSPILQELKTQRMRSEFIQGKTNAVFGSLFGPAYTYLDICRIALYIQNPRAQEKGVATHCFQYYGDAVTHNKLRIRTDCMHRDLRSIIQNVFVKDEMLNDLFCPRCIKSVKGFCSIHKYAERLSLEYALL